MMLLWPVRYLHRTEKQFKTRRLYLDTTTLDPVTRAAVEFLAEYRSSKTERDILKYRHLFVEGAEEGAGNVNNWGRFSTVGPAEYLEDETSQEITPDEMAQVLSGSPTARVIPWGARQHDIDFMLAQPKPLPLTGVSLSPDDTRLMGYFVRDVHEMLSSAFMKDGPGSLKWSGPFMSPSSNPTLETPATDDEIRSFVTIFRRLYMTGRDDQASFLKVIPIFCIGPWRSSVLQVG